MAIANGAELARLGTPAADRMLAARIASAPYWCGVFVRRLAQVELPSAGARAVVARLVEALRVPGLVAGGAVSEDEWRRFLAQEGLRRPSALLALSCALAVVHHRALNDRDRMQALLFLDESLFPLLAATQDVFFEEERLT